MAAGYSDEGARVHSTGRLMFPEFAAGGTQLGPSCLQDLLAGYYTLVLELSQRAHYLCVIVQVTGHRGHLHGSWDTLPRLINLCLDQVNTVPIICLLFLAYQSTKESEMQIVISGAISHSTAVSMLDQTSDCGARDFMNSLVSAAEHKQPSEYNGVM